MKRGMYKQVALRLDRLRAALKEQPMRHADMRALLNVTNNTLARYLKALAGDAAKGIPREAYVLRWDRNTEGGQPIAWFTYGDKPDAPKPRPLTDSEQSKRYYRKMKREDPAKYCAYLNRARLRSKMRHRQMAGKPLVPADPMLAWIPRREA